MIWPSCQSSLLLLLLSLLFLSSPVKSYRHGDVIWSMRRVSVGNESGKESTDWAEMLAAQCPRFSSDKKVLFDFDSKFMQPGQTYQMTFSFGNNQFVTHPIKIADLTKSPPVYLNFVTFSFVYSGDDVISLKWKTDYSDDGEANNVEDGKRTITVLYQWEERQRFDVRLALNIVFLSGTTICALLIAWILGPGEKANAYVAHMAKTMPRQTNQRPVPSNEDVNAGDTTREAGGSSSAGEASTSQRGENKSD